MSLVLLVDVRQLGRGGCQVERVIRAQGRPSARVVGRLLYHSLNEGLPPFASDLLADRIDQVHCPKVEYLGLRAWDGAVKRRHKRDHDIVNQVRLAAPVGKVHSLAETGVAHFLLAHLDADSVETLVQEKVEGHLCEARCSQEIAPCEDPTDLVHIGVSVGDPEVNRRGDNENRHLDRQKMCLEKSVEQDQQAAVIWPRQSVGHNIRENATLRCDFNTELVNLDIWDICIRAVIPTSY